MKIEIGTLSKKDIPGYSNLIKSVIWNSPYYNSTAKKGEMSKNEISSIKLRSRDKNNIYLIAKDENEPIGFLYGYYDCGTFFADWAGCRSNMRRNGVVTKLLEFLEKTLKKQKISKIWCDTRTTNNGSILLLKKLKFKKTAELKKHWYGQDLYLWYKNL